MAGFTRARSRARAAFLGEKGARGEKEGCDRAAGWCVNAYYFFFTQELLTYASSPQRQKQGRKGGGARVASSPSRPDRPCDLPGRPPRPTRHDGLLGPPVTPPSTEVVSSIARS